MSNNRNGYNRRTTRRAFTGLGMIVALVASSTLVMQVGTCVPTPTEPLAVTATATPAGTTAPTTVALSATATGGSGTYTYNWVAVPAVTIAAPSAASTTATVATGGTYSFTVTVSDGVSTVTATKAVTINAPTPPAITVAASGPSTATGGTNVTLTAITTGGTAPVSFAWEITALGTAGSATLTPADGISQAIVVAFSTDASGAFAFQVTATDAAAQTASAAKTVTVTPGSVTTSTTFTMNTDNLTGTTGDDTFTAPALFNAGDGKVYSTLQTGDKADGLAGANVLNAVLGADGIDSPAPQLSNIQTLNFTSNTTGGATVVATNITGATSVNSVNSSTALTVGTVPSLVNVGVYSTLVNTTVNMAAAAAPGADDTMGLTLSAVGTLGTTPNVTIGTVTGIENVAVTSTGATANRIGTFAMGAGTALKKYTFAGAQDLYITAVLPFGAGLPVTVDGSAATGKLDLLMPNAAVAITGGAGDDRFTFGDGEFTTADTFNGGAGTNTIGIADTTLVALDAQANALNAATNYSWLEFTNTAAITGVDANAATSVLNYLFSGDTNNNVTVTNTNNTDVYKFSVSRAVCTFTPQTDNLSNVLNVQLNKATAAVTLAQIVAGSGSYETIAITSEGFNGNVITDCTNKAAGTVTVAGSKNLTITAFGTASVICNASAFTGNLTVSGTTGIDDITGGSGSDIIITSVVAPLADSLTGGAGIDKFRFARSTASGALAAVPTVTDLVLGTDFFSISEGNTFAAGGATGLAQGGGAAGSLAATTAGAVTIKSVAQSTGASAIGASDQFIKLTTGVATAATDQLTFNAAIGTSTITGLTNATSMAGSYYDTTNSQMVVFEVLCTATTDGVIESADVIRVIARVNMTAANYALFNGSNMEVY